VQQVGDVACHTGARGCFYEQGECPSVGGPAALPPPADALSDRARLRVRDQQTESALEPVARLQQACEALALQWLQAPDRRDVEQTLALLDALQDSLAARGIPWRELLRQARRAPLG